MKTRLALFDIDGTLLRPGNRVHGRAIVQAATEVTGHDIMKHFPGVDAGGRTDRYIVSELLRRCGVPSNHVDRYFTEIAERSVVLTGRGLAETDPGWVLEGSVELILAMKTARIPLGLVTGNLPEIARLKLTCAQLWHYFAAQNPLIAGFGDLSEDRNDLARAAYAQARRHLGEQLDPSNVVVIGDTPRDVECAHSIGARCLAVSTGRYSAAELRAAGADIVTESLSTIDVAALW